MSTKTTQRPVIEAKAALREAFSDYATANGGERSVVYRDWPDLCAILDNPFNAFKDRHIAHALSLLEEEGVIECDDQDEGGYKITLLIKL